VQIEELDAQISNAEDDAASTTIYAGVTGRIKTIFGEAGAPVADVMYEHGALAVLSLDGLMAVDFETESTLSVGTVVTVTLSDGTEVSGKITKNLAGEMTVTVEDDSYTVGDAVQVTAEDGTSVGSGELYIYSPRNATAYAGTVDSIKVSVGDKLSAGKTLMVLSDVGYSATYRQLIGQRQEYEELMLELFKMYQTETITAPCDGVVSGIDRDSVQLLSDNGQGFVLSFLSNAPNGNDDIQYANYVGKVNAVGQNGWSLLVNPQPIPITDYMDLSVVPMDEAVMTQVCTYPDTPTEEDTTPAPEEPSVPEEGAPSEGEMPSGENPTPPTEAPGTAQLQTVPVYELVNGAWQQIAFSSVGVGDILLFAADQSGEFVWIVRIKKANNEPSMPSGGFPSGNMGGYVQTPEPEFEPYSLDVAEIAAVTPQNTMTLDITIDELDIKALQVGMTAQV